MTTVSPSCFLTFAAGVLGVPADVLSLDTAYGTLPEWDSVMHLRLVMEIEGEYGLELPVEEIADLRTLRAFYERVR